MSIDVDELLAKVDCREVVERDLGTPKRHRNKYDVYLCPLHSEHTASFTVYEGGYRCYGCDASGTAVGWLMRWHGLSFEDACKKLGGKDDPNTPRKKRLIPQETPLEAPGLEWQAAAREVLVGAQRTLWSVSGAKALRYLRGRGLTDETIQRAGLGYVPGGFKEWRAMGGLNVPCGIVIPWVIETDLWQLKVRRAAGKPKYQQVPGGCPYALYGIDKIDPYGTVMIVEGEFDSLIVNQTGLLGSTALGRAGNGLHGRWIDRLVFARRLYLRLDDDTAGANGVARLRGISSRITPVQVPGYKDCNEFDLADREGFKGWLRALAEG